MPQIVDKDKMKLRIIEAFERLCSTRPLTTISLREIAAEAGLSHSTILKYFENKTNLYVAGVHWASSILHDSIRQWFETHSLKDYKEIGELLEAFLTDFRNQRDLAVNPHSVVMACALGDYNEEIRSAIREENAKLIDIFSECVAESIGRSINQNEAYSLLILFLGVYLNTLNEDADMSASLHPVLGLSQLLSQ